MPKGTNQKLKLYRLAQIMLEQTDDEHYITMAEIMEALRRYDITADRKSLYNDLRDLSSFGIEVEGESVGNRYHYHVVSRPFELPELKLQRQVYVSGRIKTMNESIYYSVNTIHAAISENRKIKFQYYQWNAKKEMELRHNGKWYHISPWGLLWDDENYYMIGFDSEAQKIKHYRVDKMLKINLSEDPRDGKEAFSKLNMADYTKKSFGMYGGKEEKVKLLIHNDLVGVIIDRFGRDIMLFPADADHVTANVDVRVSRQFLAWVFSLGPNVKILGPEDVVETMKREASRLMEQYKSKKFCTL